MRRLLILSLLLSCEGVHSIKCGKPLTTACLGDTDIRYDPDSSNVAADQSLRWSRSLGLYIGEGTIRVNAFAPLVAPIPVIPDATILSLQRRDFLNTTHEGSRQSVYSVGLVRNIPPPQVSERVAYTTTTHEKDGTLISLPAFDRNTPFTKLPNFTFDLKQASRSYPIDGRTGYLAGTAFGDDQVESILSISRVCLDDNCDQVHESFDIFRPFNGTVSRVYNSESKFTRAASAQAWKDAILAEYETSNIAQNERLDPKSDPCSAGLCPNEAEWCVIDPNCSISPYQEPPAQVKAGAIAGFVIAGILLLVLILFGVHKYLQAKQADRYRTMFARRIADTIQVRSSMRSLTPAALADEFNKMNSDVQDGQLSKEELWEFVSSGKAGEMDQKDFDALFAAIDLDKNGTVDFLEFCAFMGKCDNEYRAVRRRSSVVAQSATRMSLASSITKKLAQLPEENSMSDDHDGEDN